MAASGGALLASGCFTTVSIILGVVAVFAFVLAMVFGVMFRVSGSYKQAMQAAQNDPAVIEAMGAPIKPRWLPIDGEIQLLVDGTDGIVYLGADALGGLLPADSAWISIDLAVLAERSGVSLDDLRSEFVVDPAASAQALLDADNAVELGTEEIDGVTVRHYEVTVDLAAAIAAAPQAAEQFDAELGQLDAVLPDTVTYDVWVTEDNQLRRVAFDITVADQTVSMVLDMTTSSEPLDLQVPADAFDVTSWLDW